ncbi:hypothetical protein BCL80_10552 [Streptomyces avidinii]|nr:hypothetical protein BCL80_10552 [Streptomyces avidinii]SNX77099.1 hypothetical protein SAMN05421860_10452 [Streptomyces microflavus]
MHVTVGIPGTGRQQVLDQLRTYVDETLTPPGAGMPAADVAPGF